MKLALKCVLIFAWIATTLYCLSVVVSSYSGRDISFREPASIPSSYGTQLKSIVEKFVKDPIKEEIRSRLKATDLKELDAEEQDHIHFRKNDIQNLSTYSIIRHLYSNPIPTEEWNGIRSKLSDSSLPLHIQESNNLSLLKKTAEEFQSREQFHQITWQAVVLLSHLVVFVTGLIITNFVNYLCKKSLLWK